MAGPVLLDGSSGEGGGQILRTAVTLAALTGRTVQIHNIRARRDRPGLQPQHLTAVHAGARLCEAALEGDRVGSSHLLFQPRRPVETGRYEFHIGTAGAAPLVLQTVLLPLMLAEGPSSVTVTGGTHLPHAPAADYLERVYLPALSATGLPCEYEWPLAGYYPRGGGRLLAATPGGAVPCPIRRVERGAICHVTASVLISNLPDEVLERGMVAVESALRDSGLTVRIEPLRKPAASPGAAVVLSVRCDGEGLAGFTGIGARGKRMETVAGEPCAQLLEWWAGGAAVDEHLADQLVLPAALAEGESRWTAAAVTDHLRTVLEVVALFLPIRWELEERAAGTGEVTLWGAGAPPWPGETYA